MNLIRRVSRVIVVLVAATMMSAASVPAFAAPLARDAVPEPLTPWVDWVLRGQESKNCPFSHNAFDRKHCAWPGELRIEVDKAGASFEQEWRLHTEDWIPLPGNDALWPQQVRVDGSAVVVSVAGASPRVRAAPGTHTVSGRILFDRAPEFIQLPTQIGLVRLRVSGRDIAIPEFDAQGRLWIAGDGSPGRGEPEAKNTLELRVFRRVVDDVPLSVRTRIELDVAGEHREVLIGPALLNNAIPMSLQSNLPARVEADGKLRIQVRPGRWAIHLTGRQPGETATLTRQAAVAPWPGDEIWVFDARNHIRLAQIEGVPSVEPRQTSLPDNWRNLPAYRVGAGDPVNIVVRRRGDAHPEADRLSLLRTLWLDFDGAGFTVNDQISGQLSRSWRIEAEPVLELGRVAVDSEPWFITRREGSEKNGVELRRGALALSADARIEERGNLPVIGWDQDFQHVRAQLNVPPGWRLLSATGIDRVNFTWLSRWTLFDLFLILIIAAVAARLWGWRWGIAALAAIALVFHESDAPKYVWLHIFAAIALLRVLPTGNFARWVRLYRNLALVALAIILIPFAVTQVRVALFPQLERPWQAQAGIDVQPAIQSELPKNKLPQRGRLSRKADVPASAPAQVLEEKVAGVLSDLSAGAGVSGGESDVYLDNLAAVDPKANIQTGPGLPRWQWQTIDLVWNGPVNRDQSIQLLLLSPSVNLVLRIASVVLLALLALRALDLTARAPRLPAGGTATAAAFMLVSGLVLIAVPESARADAFPNQQLLDELRARLTEPPVCAPACATSPRLTLNAENDRVSVRMEVHAAARVAVPLPGRLGAWLPDHVQIDGIRANGVLRSKDGLLWVVVGPGIHQLSASGSLAERDRVEITLPLRPHRAEINVSGWEVDGVHDDGVVEGQIQLRRVRAATEQTQALEPGTLPPFVRVERTLVLGLEWRLFTRLVRLSPPGSAVVLQVPLIDGESVTSDGVRVENERVQVNLGAQQNLVQWESVLKVKEQIELRAPEVTSWTEIWRLDVSPIWHVETSGIPVIHQQQQGRRFPQWHPWPGESVIMKVSRPGGVPGKTLTIDASEVSLRPGQRATDADLRVRLRSSQGVQHAVTLPAAAALQSVAIDGRPQPIRQDDRVVTLPLPPGEHELKLSWRSPVGISARFVTPDVDLGAESVNAAIKVDVPRSRWVLFAGGPALGPAVMFWGLLIVVVAVAFGLGRSRRTPLKTRHWILLGLGLSQIPIYLAIVVVGWLFALDARQRIDSELKKWQFNLMQVGLALLTVVALGLLFYAVKQGLLGLPDMQIGGNGSSGYGLRWFQDRSGASLPEAWVLSVPLTVYRVLMLAWALWIAFALVAWLRWSWMCFSAGGYWRSIVLGRPKHSSSYVSTDDASKDKDAGSKKD